MLQNLRFNPDAGPAALLLSAAILMAASTPAITAPLHPPAAPGGLSGAHPAISLSTLPISFEPNQGQTSPEAQFLAHGSGYSVFLNGHEAIVALHAPVSPGKIPGQKQTPAGVLRMKLLNASAHPASAGEETLPGHSSYFIGSDPKKWHSGIPTYEKVRFKSVYPGIDLVYYGNGRQLEHDFVLAPGADAGQIRLRMEGLVGKKGMGIDSTGSLRIPMRGGEVRLERPVLYQEINGRKQNVAGQYSLQGNRTVGFSTANYDHHWPLVIDPVLSYSSYLGGSSTDQGSGIAVDSSGAAYVTGFTQSSDFPTIHAFQTTNNTGGNDAAFVSKIGTDTNGNAVLLYSSYLGGSRSDQGNAIAVDSSGNAYVTGFAKSSDFPTTHAFRATGNGLDDTFVSKIGTDVNGNAVLLYSSYLGGSKRDQGQGIAVDSGGGAFVTGFTYSTDFPTTTDAFQTTKNTGINETAFVSKIGTDTNGNAVLLYSSYLGGSSRDRGQGIAVDSSGNAYVTGFTDSLDFPSTHAFQAANPTPNSNVTDHAFVTKFRFTSPITVTGGFTVTGAENRSTLTQTVATFTDPGGAGLPGNYSATIVWGDNTTTSPGAITGPVNGVFTVSGTHTYAEEGAFPIAVIVHQSGADSTPAASAASIADAVVSLSPFTIAVVSGAGFITNVASISDANTSSTAADYTVTVDWGDGTTPSAGTATSTGTPGQYSISGSHTYATAGTFPTTITAADTGGYMVSANGSANVLPAVTLTGANGSASEQIPFNSTVASFTPPSNGSSYTATINWGDGTTATTAVVTPGTPTTISGNHTYLTPGGFTVSTTLSSQGLVVGMTTSTIVVSGNWQALGISGGASDSPHVLWNDTLTDTASFWNLDNSNLMLSSMFFGPFPSWTAREIAYGPTDSYTRLLWNRTDGAAALWTVHPDNTHPGDQIYGPYAGWSAVAVSTANDNTSRILWDKTDGTVSFWTVDAAGAMTNAYFYGPFTGYTAVDAAVGPDGNSHILWQSTSGQVALWNVDTSGKSVSQYFYGPYTGWTATADTVTADGNTHILWNNNSTGQIALWNVDSSGNHPMDLIFGPYTGGWKGTEIAPGGTSVNPTVHLLWSNPNTGQASIWTVDNTGSHTTDQAYGPY